MSLLRIGLDCGLLADPSAVAAVQCIPREGPLATDDAGSYLIRQVKRIPLYTPYPDVAAQVVAAAVKMRDIEAQRRKAEGINPLDVDPPDVTVYVDATGVGAPVVGMLDGPLAAARVRLVPVIIAAGDELKQVIKDIPGHPYPRYLRVGKEYLVGRLQALLQTARIQGGGSDEFREMQKQLASFQRFSTSTSDTYGAKSGQHDDLVISLALATLDDVPAAVRDFADLNAMMRKPISLKWPRTF